jgi:chemotaxis protein MotA
MKRKDIATYFGVFVGIFCIIIGMALNDGKVQLTGLRLFWDLPSVFITVGGSFCSVAIAFPMSDVKRLPLTLKNAFIDRQLPGKDIIQKFVELSIKARREGLLSLENEVETIDEDFIKNGIQMVVDGIEPETIRDIMELEIGEMEKRHVMGINILKAWAGYGPAYGMIGTLIGLVQMLSSMSNPNSLGPGMSKAIITSFYGSVMANFIFGPLANKLENKSAEEAGRREMIMEGVLALQAGVNPRIIEDKLKSYLSPKERKRLQNVDSQGSVVTEGE